jgi:hypothetical protein
MGALSELSSKNCQLRASNNRNWLAAQATAAEPERQLLRHVRVVCCLNISLQAKCETGADLLGGGKTTGHGGVANIVWIVYVTLTVTLFRNRREDSDRGKC